MSDEDKSLCGVCGGKFAEDDHDWENCEAPNSYDKYASDYSASQNESGDSDDEEEDEEDAESRTLVSPEQRKVDREARGEERARRALNRKLLEEGMQYRDAKNTIDRSSDLLNNLDNRELKNLERDAVNQLKSMTGREAYKAASSYYGRNIISAAAFEPYRAAHLKERQAE